MLVDTSDQRAARRADVEALGDRVVDRLNAHTEPTAARLVILLELIDHRHDARRGGGEADADRPAGRRKDRGVDADHFALHVEQRAARIALVDRGVGLQEVVVWTAVDVSIARRDDARGHGFAEAEGIADRHHAVADAHLVAVAELHRLQRLVALDLEHGNVHLGILTDDLRLQLAPVGEDHHDVVGVADDVIVGDDDAARIDHEARTQRRRLVGARRAVVEAVVLEELLEHVVEGRALRQVRHSLGVFVLDRLRRRNVDHRLGDAVDEVGQIGRARLRECGRGGHQRRRRADRHRCDTQDKRHALEAVGTGRRIDVIKTHGVLSPESRSFAPRL